MVVRERGTRNSKGIQGQEGKSTVRRPTEEKAFWGWPGKTGGTGKGKLGSALWGGQGDPKAGTEKQSKKGGGCPANVLQVADDERGRRNENGGQIIQRKRKGGSEGGQRRKGEGSEKFGGQAIEVAREPERKAFCRGKVGFGGLCKNKESFLIRSGMMKRGVGVGGIKEVSQKGMSSVCVRVVRTSDKKKEIFQHRGGGEMSIQVSGKREKLTIIKKRKRKI